MELKYLEATEIGGKYLMYDKIGLGKGAFGEVY